MNSIAYIPPASVRASIERFYVSCTQISVARRSVVWRTGMQSEDNGLYFLLDLFCSPQLFCNLLHLLHLTVTIVHCHISRLFSC